MFCVGVLVFSNSLHVLTVINVLQALAMCFLCKCKDLNSVPRTNDKKQSAEVRACNPWAGETETGRSLRLACQSAHLWANSLSVRDAMSKTKVMTSEED